MTSSAGAVNHVANVYIRRCARIAGLRALAWSGDILYASRGYDLLRARIQDASRPLDWELVGSFRPAWIRMLSVRNRFTSRLFRDGFHALAVLPGGDLVAAVPGAIITKRSRESQFRSTHAIMRGTRPLHITSVPSGPVYWGEYFDNSARDEVHIYASIDSGSTWSPAYTFPKGAIRHVHNIVHDSWGNCLWILTGDYDDECRILRATCDLSNIEVVLQGNQQARAVAAIATEDGLYFSSDTPLETNHIYRLERNGVLTELAEVNSSSIYGCRVNDKMFFSTMIEPSKVNHDRSVRLYAADVHNSQKWDPVLSWEKDLWPMGLFQYGNAFLPDGNNKTQYLAVTTIAVESEDMVTSLYAP
jgi:hypothetical protein